MLVVVQAEGLEFYMTAKCKVVIIVNWKEDSCFYSLFFYEI